jgi:hypothetical protein
LLMQLHNGYVRVNNQKTENIYETK